MGTQDCSSYTGLPWKHSIYVVLLLSHLCCVQVWAQCKILKCNSEFVAATLDLGGGAGREGGNAGYCSALRSYSHCTRRTARACRGDLAFHSAVQGIEDLLMQHSCPKTGPTARPRRPTQVPISRDACFYEKSYLQREGKAPEYLHCGVFGDPHVRTFHDEFQTCAVQGAWPLIDNDYLYVQATSEVLPGEVSATALTKITIIFKNWRECIEQQNYRAELDNVPPAFLDGSITSGERRGHHSLQVSTGPGRHAQINATHIGTTLVVRQSGRSLSLSVRAPRAIVDAFSPEQDLQLCKWGCPASQRLEHPPPQPGTDAYTHCASLLPAKDMYFQACLFDLLTTGDVNFSSSAVAALQDARGMIADTGRVHLLTAAATSSHLSCALLTLLIVSLTDVTLSFLLEQSV
ncbi:hypothetical protein AALO_G00178420 [Alosa alosa]|uniref:Hemojuvelin n=1 Tax=Alosa alosa TaxID=278164 RepID=A0AAV6GBS9_9TELE|nr:hemojuvelin [Alosa alosa]KAG5271321.1 hypothetical protein AALO_G00178420 [Alosa alosa]